MCGATYKCKVYIIFNMFWPKIVYLTIKNRLLHVICRLLSTARGLREVFCVRNFADYVKVPQIYVSFGHIRKHASKHLRDT